MRISDCSSDVCSSALGSPRRTARRTAPWSKRASAGAGQMESEPTSLILIGVLASLGAGLATTLGALPALLLRDISEQTQDVLLGFAAGVMLAAAFFPLILPGLEAAAAPGAGEVGALTIALSAILLGPAGLPLVPPHPPPPPHRTPLC